MGGIRRFLGTGRRALERSAQPREDPEARFFEEMDKISDNRYLSAREKQRRLERLAEKYGRGGQDSVKSGGVLGNITVQPAHAAVVHDRGRVREGAFGSGAHWGIPGATEVDQFDLRVQRIDLTLHVLSCRKLPFEIDLTVLHRLDAGAVRAIFLTTGHEYSNTLIEPFLTKLARSLAYEKTDEELMDPLFAEELSEFCNTQFSEAGLHIDTTVRTVRPASVVTQAYSALAEAEYTKMRLEASMEVLMMQAKLIAMEIALERQIRTNTADITATVERVLGNVQIDLEQRRRQPNFITEAYLREKIINAGGGAIFADAMGELVGKLAEILETHFKKK